MEENTNKAIFLNSIVLYGRMFVTALSAILATRFALKALGVSDFGLFSLLGGIISFVSIFNTIMLSTTNRFIAVSLGKGNIEDANIQFNVNLVIHIVLAVLTILIAFPIGDWYINNYVNYDGDISNAIMIYRWSIVGSTISFLGVPYNGLLMAKEKFIVFSITDVVTHIVKMLIAYLLIGNFYNKIHIYAVSQSILTAIPTFVYIIYCNKNLYDITRLIIVKDKSKYIEVFKFSGWIAYGAIATVAKNQGASVLVNTFFTTTMNTALGVANSINSYIQIFSQNISQPIAPQLTKSYSAGDMQRCKRLLIMSTKMSFLVMLLISTPFLVGADYFFILWLGHVPEYATIFLKLLIIDSLVSSLYVGVSNVVFASGKIAAFQFWVNTIRLLSIPSAFLVLRAGAPVWAIFVAYIVITTVIFFVEQIILRKVLNYNTRELYFQSYFPSLLTLVICLPTLLFKLPVQPFLQIIVSFIYVSIAVLFVGFSIEERKYIYNTVLNKITSGKKIFNKSL